MNIDCCSNSSVTCTGENEECSDCICSCLSSYQYDEVDKVCILAKALPGENCLEASDCVEGLICINNTTCSCDGPCTYEPDSGSCVCGNISLETPVAVIVIGIVLGFTSVVVWILCISKTVSLERTYTNPVPSDEYNVNQLRMVSIRSPIISEMQRSFSKEVSVTHGANCYGQPVSPSTDDSQRRFSSAMTVSEVESGRMRTPDPYSGVKSLPSPLKSGFCPTAPVEPQYPVTLLPQDEVDKYLENTPYR